ncbi:DUF1616 domain-containing protein [Candidatus Woesearchaeota archaeon]|nr:DUF1616 domain-containing protein [Candidatus Woesearchaeota archaeon]
MPKKKVKIVHDNKKEGTDKESNLKMLHRGSLIVLGIVFFIGISLSYLYKISLLAGLRASFGAFLIVFLPGYLITKILFRGFDWVETTALSFCLSIGSVGLLFIITNKLLFIPLNSLTNLIILLFVCVALIGYIHWKQKV